MDDEQLKNDGEAVSQILAHRLIARREILASLRNLVEATPDLDLARFARRALEEDPDLGDRRRHRDPPTS